MQVLLLLMASVALMYLAFLKSYLGWLALISLIPLFFAIEKMQQDEWSPRKKVISIWLTGWAFMALVTSWILSINTSGWSYIPTSPLLAILIFCWLAFSLLLSTGFLIFGYALTRFKLKLTSAWAFLVIPALWILAEFIRSYITTFAALGPGGTLGNFFSFGSLGYALVNTPLGYAGRLVGMYGLSFVVVTINLGIYALIKKHWKTSMVAIISAIALGVIGYFAYLPPRVKEHVSVIQLAQKDRSSYASELTNKLKNSDRNVPSKLIVMPEYANFFDYGNEATNSSLLQTLTQNEPALVVFSRSKNNPEGLRKNEIVYKSSSGSEISTQEKNFLVPTGEYMPYVLQFILKVFNEDQITAVFNNSVGVAKGGLKEHPVKYGQTGYGALACSGVIAPQLYRDLTLDGAEVLINTASLDVFKDVSSFRDQSTSMARFIATSNARPFLQSARGSKAFIMNSNGKMLAQSSGDDVDVLSADVATNDKKTIYTILGEYVLVIAMVIIIAYGFLEIKKAKRK